MLDEIKKRLVQVEDKIGPLCCLAVQSATDHLKDTSLLSHLKEFPNTGIMDYLPDSRPGEIQFVSSCVERSDTFQFIWLHGGAGVGKSTLARYLADCVKQAGCLAAFASFKRGTTGEWSVKDVVQAIARQIVYHLPSTRARIIDGLGDLTPESDYQSLLRSLIFHPLSSLDYSAAKVIILDGWDEYAYSNLMAEGLQALKDSSELPKSVSIIMTSRHVPAIREEIQYFLTAERAIGLVDHSTMMRFFDVHLAKAEPKICDPNQRIPQLVDAAEGLFVWAATACAIICNPDAAKTPDHRLDEILANGTARFKSSSALFTLYSSALTQLFPEPERDSESILYAEFPLLMALLMIIPSPMTAGDLHMLIDHDYPIPRFSSLLRSLQTSSAPQGTNIITPCSAFFHASLLDYLYNHCEVHFRITPNDLERAHSFLAEKCIQAMTQYFGDKHPSNISDHPSYILYAAHNWAVHAACNDIESWNQPLQSNVDAALRKFLITQDVFSSWVHATVGEYGLGYDAQRDDHLQALSVFAGDILSLSETQIMKPDLMRGVMFVQLASCRLNGTDSRSLNTLGYLQYRLWSVEGLILHLQSCIEIRRKVLDLHPPGHPERSMSLNNLAVALRIRYEQTGGMADLDRAISLHEEALNLRPPGHPDRSRSLNNLATALRTRYEQSGGMADLDRAMSLNEEALNLHPPGHPDRSRSLNNLANALRTRYEQTVTGGMADLDRAISLHEEALNLRPPGHPDRSRSLNNLATALRTRYEQNGGMADLDQAMSLNEEALNLHPPGHPDRSRSLNNLAVALRIRYEQRGGIADLDRAIYLHEETLNLHPPGHPDRSLSLNNLAYALQTHYEESGGMADLDRAIYLHEEALNLHPTGHPDRSMSLNNLANAIRTRYEQSGRMADLDRAISLYEEALDLRPPGHPGRSRSLNNLASALRTRYEQSGGTADLDRATSLEEERKALDLRPSN
jgi:hypothetical protein